MKNKLLVIALLLVGNFTVYGCSTRGSGIISSEIRPLEKFSGVDLKNSANVFIKQGDVQEVKVEADDNILHHITTEIKNNELIISCDEDINTKEPITVYITMKDLSLIELSGSGNIITESQFKSESMLMKLSGSGNITASIDSKVLKMVLSGSGDLLAKGRAASAEIKISGSGNIKARELATFTSQVTITGSGTSTVDVNNELTVNITGSGNVFYISDPERIHSTINGSGRIEKIS